METTFAFLATQDFPRPEASAQQGVEVRMTQNLEQALATIVVTFQQYCHQSGDKHKLCQAELKELLRKELPTWTPVSTLAAQWVGTTWTLQSDLGCSIPRRRSFESVTMINS
ncbi:PREDICTED: protein S100-A3 isoform X2 [Chinchilla lanigera]|uniref:protein S100-A3 isoform X2 n=1 Tax=Chinchilla lanigera TaxID=34839 RepID=UPI0006990642|nr:PREDICTED: protein S100-A3 isoform X2 [Chinchilla lanigera]